MPGLRRGISRLAAHFPRACDSELACRSADLGKGNGQGRATPNSKRIRIPDTSWRAEIGALKASASAHQIATPSGRIAFAASFRGPKKKAVAQPGRSRLLLPECKECSSPG